MTAGAATLRPSPPATSGRYFLPFIAAAVATGIFGLWFGASGALWGAGWGAVVAGALWWLGLARSPLLSSLLVAVGAGSGIWVDWVLAQRDGPVDLPLSLAAGAAVAVFGFAVGAVLMTRGGPYHLGTVVTGAAVWGVAATLALLWGAAMGYIETLRRGQIEAGEIQALDGTFYFWFGVIVIAVGLGTTLSLWVGTPALAGTAGAAVFTVFSANLIGFSFDELLTQIGRLDQVAKDFWPPEWTWSRFVDDPAEFQILTPMIETLQIAVIGATLGCAAALPLAFLASRPTSFTSPIYWFARTLMNVIRTIPDLFWAIFFVTAVGAGTPFAGALAMVMFSLAIMAKLLSETVDTIDLGPLEAARASGSRHFQMVQYAAFPQVAPNYVAYALYIFELNIRASVVIGIVGAGGIGRLLDEQRTFFQWDRVMAIVLVIFVFVIVIELISVYIRRKLV